MMETLEQTLTAYSIWLDRQPLAAKTRVASRFQVHQYGAYLARLPPTADDPLHTPTASDYAIRDYKTSLKTERQAKPTSVNLALAAIDHFHQFLGNDRPQVSRESLSALAPRALKPEEQKVLLRAIDLVIRRIRNRCTPGTLRPCVTPHLPDQSRPWRK